MDSISSAFELLDYRIQQWIWRQGWTSLRDIQEKAIPIILDGEKDVIISAETAGGKTEAVFLPILTSILKCSQNEGYDAIYISPLKSLINDQRRRLEDITRDLFIPITPWHGEISTSKKRKSLNTPKGIIIITPESLESLFMHHHHEIKHALKSIRYVIIDELHYFISSERGKQLQSLLSRLEIIIDKKVPRIAMSATFSNYEIVKYFMRNDNSLPCVVLESNRHEHETRILVKEYTYEKRTEIITKSSIANDIFSNMRGSNNLVFTNSRDDCELYGTLLKDKCLKENVPNEFCIHHGSLSKEIRNNVEQELQQSQTPITAICTSTMELGVDIGKVKSIAQIQTANSVSSLRQRLGRSGRRNEPSYLRIYSIDKVGQNPALLSELKANLIQNIAVIELLKEHKYETPFINGYHFSTLIQQILSIILEYGWLPPKVIWSILCEHGAFNNVNATLFLELIKILGENNVISQATNGNLLIGATGEDIISSEDFYAAFNSVPELDIINSVTGEHIGSLVGLFRVGSFIILNGNRWKIIRIDYNSGRVFVIPTDVGNIPIFWGECLEIDEFITHKMRDIYLSDDIYPYLDKKTNTIECLISSRNFFKSKKLDISPFFSYNDKIYCCTFAGTKINRTISLIANMLIEKKLNYSYVHFEELNKEDICTILNMPKPKPEELCILLTREGKEKNKFDFLLSDRLLDLEYSKSYLDVDAAWLMLESLSKF